MGDLVKLTEARLVASREVQLPPPPKHELSGDEGCECGGFGYVRLNVAQDDPRFGQPQPCPSCKGAQRERIDPVVGLPLRFQTARFENFDTKRSPGMAPALAACREIVTGQRDRLLLYGPPGLGKTHLLAATVQAARAAGLHAWFWEVPDLLAHLRERMRQEAIEAEIENLSSRAVLLALDDYGAHNATDWTQEQLYRILNHRYSEGAATIITSNVPMEALDERIRSRWRDGLVLCEGEDVRGK